MSLERLWAGWRSEYVEAADDNSACVFCRVLESTADDAYLLWRGRWAAAVLNAFPYTNGHLMVFPVRHVAEPEGLATEESAELWQALSRAMRAMKSAYRPDGINMGANLGRVAGAGVPGHFHMHVLPRWSGDTNFMTTVAEARVMPESLRASYERLTTAWPA